MSKSVNSVRLLGHVGKAPEVRTASAGTMVANFSLATTERVKENNQWTDRTEWHSLVAFGRLTEIIRDYVTKGSKVYIEGKLQTRSWEDKNTHEKRYKTEIVVGDLILLDRKEADEPSVPKNHFNPQSDSEIPF